MKRVRNHHIDYDDDQEDSIHADLKGAYERGRRDQRDSRHGARRSSPMMLLLMGGIFIGGGWLLLGALNQRSSLPGMASIDSSPASASQEAAPSDRAPRALEDGWTTAER